MTSFAFMFVDVPAPPWIMSMTNWSWSLPATISSQAFAMALALHERGLFTWSEWAATIADEIKRAQAGGDPDTGETYYLHWLNTLERLVAEKGVTDRNTLARYRDAWDHAADRTPHGAPIELMREDFD